jgi:hypothetical protein
MNTAFIGTSVQTTLQSRLSEYAFPPLLASRLAAEQHWTPLYTERVLAEYRRFLLLAATSGQSVTPSKTVDEAWHEHLTLTRDYWDRLCSEVLQKPVHHEVAEAGAGADSRAYLYTLDLYAATFGQTPPEDLWPDPRRAAPPVQSAGLTFLRGSAQVRFLVFTSLVLVGFLLWQTAGLLIGLGLGLVMLLSGLIRRGSLGTSQGGSQGGGTGPDGAAWMFLGADSGSGSSDSGGGGGDGGGSSCGSACGSN